MKDTPTAHPLTFGEPGSLGVIKVSFCFFIDPFGSMLREWIFFQRGIFCEFLPLGSDGFTSGKKKMKPYKSVCSSWWFQIFFIFTPIWGSEQI